MTTLRNETKRAYNYKVAKKGSMFTELFYRPVIWLHGKCLVGKGARKLVSRQTGNVSGCIQRERGLRGLAGDEM